MPRTPALLLASVFALVACGQEAAAPPAVEPPPTIRLAVSSDAALLVERWNRALNDDGALEVQVDVLADALAYAEVLEGRAQAALVHRRASPAEDRRAKGRDLVEGEGLTYFLLGESPVSLLVHDSNPVQVVTIEQAAGLLSGAVTSWPEVGGAEIEVQRFVREPDTATWQVVDEWLGEASPASGQSLPEARAVATAVRGLPGAFGTGGGTFGPGARSLGLRLVTGELIMPLSTTSKGAVWPLQRPLLVVTRGPRGRALDAWIQRVTTPEGRAMAEQNGYVLSGAAP